MKEKIKLLYHSDSSLAKTGFGRNSKALLSHLYKTGKYDIVHYCIGINYSNPDLQRTPWKSIGCLPDDPKEMEQINKDPNYARMAGYGAHLIDKVIKEEKPDVYIAAQDIWGVDFAVNKIWFDKIPHAIWTTLDSLPILPTAVEAAKKVKNYWIWADFATQALKKMGHEHVRTVRGMIDQGPFSRLDKEERLKLRKDNNIPEKAFIAGFVFRNQLRKSVPNLLEGYSLWKEKKKPKSPYLLLHTHFGEGWPIPELAKEYDVPLDEILTTYACQACRNYSVKPFTGQNQACPHCGNKESMITTNTQMGVTEKQLNEVYNLMDVYVHPFTSGGQEIPIQEAKLTELVTLVTNYSCGEDMCVPEAQSVPLEWNEYREQGTNFRKASTSPESIAQELNAIYKLDPSERRRRGQTAREWTIKNFGIEAIGKIFEEFLDSIKKTEYDWSLKQEERNPNAQIPNMEDDGEWLVWMYHNILLMKEVDKGNDGHKYWMGELKKGVSRSDIEKYFRQVAAKENSENDSKTSDFESLLDKDDKGKRILYVIPESIGDVLMSTSLFPSIQRLYPDHNLYVATKPEYEAVLSGNPYVHKVLIYNPQMDNLMWLEGSGDHEGFFEVAYLAHSGTQRFLNYLHNDADKIDFEIKA
jgi:glycosyltransferase involved in cell wall biosynthesis